MTEGSSSQGENRRVNGLRIKWPEEREEGQKVLKLNVISFKEAGVLLKEKPFSGSCLGLEGIIVWVVGNRYSRRRTYWQLRAGGREFINHGMIGVLEDAVGTFERDKKVSI